MNLSKKEKNELYKEYLLSKMSCDETQTFEEWIEENFTRCLSCNELICKDDFDVLETQDGYYCGACRP